MVLHHPRHQYQRRGHRDHRACGLGSAGAINTKDAVTATIEHVDWDLLDKISYRITHEVPGINRCLYDITAKPTGTIEFE